jgi:hypothetical protein
MSFALTARKAGGGLSAGLHPSKLALVCCHSVELAESNSNGLQPLDFHVLIEGGRAAPKRRETTPPGPTTGLQT